MIKQFANAWNEGIVAFGVFAIFLCVLALFGFYFYQKLKKQIGNRFVAGVVVLAFAFLGFTAYPTSAEKNPEAKKDPIGFLQTDPEITYLIDKGSWVSNNVVHLEYETRLLPASAMLYLDYIAKTEDGNSTNYNNYINGTVADMPTIIEFEYVNAISNRWIFYTTHTKGPNVHTNGVAVAVFLRSTKYDNVAVPKRSTIWEGENMIYPDAETFNRSLLQELGEEGVE